MKFMVLALCAGMVLGLTGLAFAGNDQPPPTCDSSDALQAVHNSFENAQMSIRMALMINDIRNIEEYEDTDRTGIRHCTAIAFLNNNRRTIIDYEMVETRPGFFHTRMTSYNYVPMPPDGYGY